MLQTKKFRKYSSLPAHSWEPHPLTRSDETSQPFIVHVISIVLIIALSSLLLISTNFVGKAIEGTVPENVIDIIIENDIIKIMATLTPGTKTGGVYLELTSSTPGFDLCRDTIRTNQLWGDFFEESCVDGKLSFGDATLNGNLFQPRAGGNTFAILELTPAVAAPRTLQFTLNPIDVYDSVKQIDLFPHGGSFIINLQQCGDGIVGGDETCLTCPDDAGCDGDFRCTEWGTCVAPPPENVVCGDGIVDAEEECDGSAPEHYFCTDLCTLEYVPYCGDVAIDAGETCLTCSADAGCNEGERCNDAGECTALPPENVACGDGNITFGETCLTCPADASCVDDFRCTEYGECIPPYSVSSVCGDGIVNAGEECDDGNLINADACSAECTFEVLSANESGVNVSAGVENLSIDDNIGENNSGVDNGTITPLLPESNTSDDGLAGGGAPAGPGNGAAGVGVPDGDGNNVGNGAPAGNANGGAEGNVAPAGNGGGGEVLPLGDIGGNEGSSSGGSGGGCIPQWVCAGQWSYCNASLQQSQLCADQKRCNQHKLTKLENRSCFPCAESWSCSSWSICQNGEQFRTCADEHFCGTSASRPEIIKSCAVDLSSIPEIQFPGIPPQDKSLVWIIVIIISLSTTGIGVLARYYVLHRKAYNPDDLQKWIADEISAGTSVKDTITIISQHTGWNKDKIKETFPELNGGKIGVSSKISMRR